MSIADQINALIDAIRDERDFIVDEHGFAEDIATSLAVAPVSSTVQTWPTGPTAASRPPHIARPPL